MTTIFLKHTVADYDSWKDGFDAHSSTRQEYGSLEEYRLFREAENPDEIVMVGEWESPEAFDRFMAESDVKEKMAELGVTSEPEIYVLEELDSTLHHQPPSA